MAPSKKKVPTGPANEGAIVTHPSDGEEQEEEVEVEHTSDGELEVGSESLAVVA